MPRKSVPKEQVNQVLLNCNKKPQFIKDEDATKKQINELIEKVFVKTCEPFNPKVSVELENHKAIYELVQEIIKLESSNVVNVDAVDRSEVAVQDRFISWLKENGAEFENITIADYGNLELGLKATENIPKDKLICAIPRQLMLSHDKIKESGKFWKLVQKDPMLSEMNNVALAMFLLFEKFKKKSFWKPYIDMLPKSYTTVHYFNCEEMALLSGTRALKAAVSQFKNLARQFSYFFGRLWSMEDSAAEMLRKNFTFEEYRWAVSTVMTRQNLIPATQDLNEGVLALIPFWDMANHSKGHISTGYNTKLERSECTAMKDFKKDEQVFIHYHNRSNLDFFIHNGFVFEDIQNDTYPLALGISPSDKLQAKRNQILQKLGIQSTQTYFLQDSLEPFDPKLLIFCRIFVMNEQQLDKCLNDESSLMKITEPEGNKEEIDLELKSWKFLQMRLKLLLAVFKTSIKEDEEFLRHEKLTNNYKMCIRMRISDKKLLGKIAAFIEAKIRLLEAL